MEPLNLNRMPAEVIAHILERCDFKSILSLYHTDRYLRKCCAHKVNTLFSLKLKTQYPDDYHFLETLNALHTHSFSHFRDLDFIKKSPQYCQSEENIAFLAMIVNKVIAICVGGFFFAKWIAAASAKAKATWIQNYLNTHPGASLDQAYEAYNQWIASMATYRGR